jgi:hypothetical protein
MSAADLLPTRPNSVSFRRTFFIAIITNFKRAPGAVFAECDGFQRRTKVHQAGGGVRGGSNATTGRKGCASSTGIRIIHSAHAVAGFGAGA